MSAAPTLRLERLLIRAGARRVAGVDEVGRGAVAGPVSVGVVVIDASTPAAPRGLRDSKLLTAQARKRIAPRLRRWASDSSVGHAQAWEIDRFGIMTALRLAAARAMERVGRIDAVILDGAHDWITACGGRADLSRAAEDVSLAGFAPPPVTTVVGGDRGCSSVSAASVVAKTSRDQLMTRLAAGWSAYAWQDNKGYATPMHTAAMRSRGLCPQHRKSWDIAGASGP